MIDPQTHDAKIEDTFRMKTSLEYDMSEFKFQPKNSILEVIFHNNKSSVGYIEFDLGKYSNKVPDKTTMKTILDLKSDQYPGCQLYMYVNIAVLDPLPERDGTEVTQFMQGNNQSVMMSAISRISNMSMIVKGDLAALTDKADVKRFDAN